MMTVIKHITGQVPNLRQEEQPRILLTCNEPKYTSLLPDKI